MYVGLNNLSQLIYGGNSGAAAAGTVYTNGGGQGGLGGVDEEAHLEELEHLLQVNIQIQPLEQTILVAAVVEPIQRTLMQLAADLEP